MIKNYTITFEYDHEKMTEIVSGRTANEAVRKFRAANLNAMVCNVLNVLNVSEGIPVEDDDRTTRDC